jgi:hypothetical protein
MESLNDALNRFINNAQSKIISDFTRNNYTHACPRVVFTIGKKYIRVSKKNKTSNDVYCFIEINTGVIFSAKNWKQPRLETHFGSIYGLF